MTNNRFATGAFVFTRARGLEPRLPDDLLALAQQHYIKPAFVPSYPGDRTAIGRALSQAASGLSKEGFLLRPITRTSTEVVYGIVHEQRDEGEHRLDHDFEATVSWCNEPDPSRVLGDHPIARRVAQAYADLRGRVIADDWSAAITSYLESHDAARVRSDGRVYWVPPQRIDQVRRYGGFLAEVGIDLLLCEIEAESKQLITSVAEQSLDDQLEELQAEAAQFDGTQKPSTYARRLEQYEKLRERAVLYKAALGLGVDRAETVLQELETKVSSMLDLRRQSVVHRHEENMPDSRLANDEPLLVFAGASFTLAGRSDGCQIFSTGDPRAQAAVASLESLGLADRWQRCGAAAVQIKNSGPPGAEVTLTVRLGEGQTLRAAAPGLSALGIDVANDR